MLENKYVKLFRTGMKKVIIPLPGGEYGIRTWHLGIIGLLVLDIIAFFVL